MFATPKRQTATSGGGGRGRDSAAAQTQRTPASPEGMDKSPARNGQRGSGVRLDEARARASGRAGAARLPRRGLWDWQKNQGPPPAAPVISGARGGFRDASLDNLRTQRQHSNASSKNQGGGKTVLFHTPQPDANGTSPPMERSATQREYEEKKTRLFDCVDHEAALEYLREMAALEEEAAQHDSPSEEEMRAGAIEDIEKDIFEQLEIDESDQNFAFKRSVLQQLRGCQSFQKGKRSSREAPTFHASHGCLIRRVAHHVALMHPEHLKDDGSKGEQDFWSVLPTSSTPLPKKKTAKSPRAPRDPKSSNASPRKTTTVVPVARQGGGGGGGSLEGGSVADEDGDWRGRVDWRSHGSVPSAAESVDDWSTTASMVSRGQFDSFAYDSYALFDQYQQIDERLSSNAPLATYISECQKYSVAPLPVMDYITERDDDNHWDEHEECDLILPKYGIGDIHAIAFGKFLEICGLNLVEIDLEDNGITIDGMTALLVGLQAHPQVKALNLSKNKFAYIEQAGSLNQDVTKAEAALIALFPEEQPGGLHQINRLSLHDCRLQSGSLDILFGRFAAGAAPVLKYLDTSHNCMRDSSGTMLPEFIRKEYRLAELNISWNSIRKDHAHNIALALKENARLINLNIAQNHFGEEERCMVALSEALANNSIMEVFDLSYNEVMEKGAMIFGFEALKHNYHLRTINMDGNPIGPGGGMALMAFNAHGQKHISFHHCSLELDGGGRTTFDSFEPDGDYTLNLSLHLDRLVARALMELAADHQCHASAPCLVQISTDERKKVGVTLDMKPYAPPIRKLLTDGQDDEHEDGRPRFETPTDDIPNKGVLRFQFISHKTKEPIHASPEVYSKLHALVKEHAKVDERRSSQMVLNATNVYSFSSVQGRELVEHLTIRTLREEAVANVLMKMNDPHNSYHVLSALNQLEQQQVKHILGPLYLYNDANPTGQYKLDLSKKQDRLVAMKVTALSRRERLFVRKHKRPDLSQHGNGEYIRNSLYDDVPFQYDYQWVVPSEGVWEFDYVSPIRPPENAEPSMKNQEEFAEFVAAHVDFKNKINMYDGDSAKDREELYQVFEMFDADGSGDVDAQELGHIFESLGHHVSKDDLETLLGMVDSDGSGDIDFREFGDLWELFMHQVMMKERLAELRHVAATVWITAHQLKELIWNMRNGEERVGVFLVFYSRVVDEENFHHAVKYLKPKDVAQLAGILGPISLFNPFRPTNQYHLDLEHYDERLLCKMIIACNRGEPSNKPILKSIMFNGNGIAMNAWLRGEEEPPHRGRVQITIEDNAHYNKRDRAQIAIDMLGWEFEEGELEEFDQQV